MDAKVAQLQRRGHRDSALDVCQTVARHLSFPATNALGRAGLATAWSRRRNSGGPESHSSDVSWRPRW